MLVSRYHVSILRLRKSNIYKNISVADDMTAWRKISCEAGAANVGTDDAN